MKPKTIDKKAIVKPCFAYPGGKTRLLKRILPLIPEHSRYIEPFAGGLAVLLAKPRAKVEGINDLDSDIINFYRYVRFHKAALLLELGHQFSSRAEFNALLKNPGYTDLQRACRWYLLKVCSFGGMSGNFGRSLDGFTGFDNNRHSKLIAAVSDRLSRVVIECQDWQKVVDFYDKPGSFLFLDPPYVNSGKTAYAPFSEFEMQRVRDRLDQAKSMWILTCDDSEQCREIFAGLPFQEATVKYSTENQRTNASKVRKDFGELIVMAPALAEKLQAA